VFWCEEYADCILTFVKLDHERIRQSQTEAMFQLSGFGKMCAEVS
jgi:hypothetical protein